MQSGSPHSAGSACASGPRSRGSCSQRSCDRASSSSARLYLLAVLGRLPLPLRGRLAALDCFVLLARVALLRHRHNARIHHLPAARDIALRGEMLVEPIEQRLDQPGPRELLAEQPQRRAVGNAILRPKTDKSRERGPIPNTAIAAPAS